ncbi:hypothetical protein KUH03_17860 [Sphingobacterium sp. E70]|uniref:hypothetical protein n=1 Tax=Sphingobacterium sp. E70 TaxID=2853439 RepID=UPI00211B9733|nr:hypothetical protein [Sphingobacterium sp. E70]ULT28286.1 hypothetical protein KUH03_17860 [Sphingobacterium sp. E70]
MVILFIAQMVYYINSRNPWCLSRFFYAKSSKAVYTATTTFVLESGESGTSGLGQVAGLAALAGIDFGTSTGGIFQGDNLLELYKSRKMIEASLLSRFNSDSSLILLIDRYLSVMGLRKNGRRRVLNC